MQSGLHLLVLLILIVVVTFEFETSPLISLSCVIHSQLMAL